MEGEQPGKIDRKTDGDMKRSLAPNLDTLPQEIIENIAGSLGDTYRFASRDKDLAALVRTNRTLQRQLHGYLYHANQRSCHHHVRRCSASKCVKEALTWGLDRRNIETLDRAFKLGIHPRNPSQSLPTVVSNGHVPIIATYLEAVRSGLMRIDAVLPGGETALYWAVAQYKQYKSQRWDLASDLIHHHHAPVNHPVLYFAKLPLFEACRTGNMFMVDMLIANGGWINPPHEVLHLMKQSSSMSLQQKGKIYAPGFIDPLLCTRTADKSYRRRRPIVAQVHGESSSNDDSSSEDSDTSETSDNTFSSDDSYVLGHPQMEEFLREQQSRTPLEVAAEHGQVGVCELLLGLGASLESSPVFPEWTPLHAAAYAGEPDVVALLLKHGAPPDRPGEAYSALDAALGSPGRVPRKLGWRTTSIDPVRKVCECVRLLLEAKADPGPSSRVSRTLVACKRELPGIAMLLHRKGADIGRETRELLGEAVRVRDVDLVKLLLNSGQREDAEGRILTRNLLWEALLSQKRFSRDINKALLSSGADLEQRDEFGRTLLLQLATTRSSRAVSRCALLASCGADTSAREPHTGRTAAHVAVEEGNVDALHNMVRSPLFNFTLLDDGGRTPLFCAACNGHDIMVNLILSRGKTKDWRRWDKTKTDWSGNVADASGKMPIIAALSMGHLRVVKSFLTADPRTMLARDNEGHGVLWWAHASPNPRMRKMVKESARRAKIRLEDDLTDLYCRQCKYRRVGSWRDANVVRYHCPSCYGDGYYICKECKEGGAACLDPAHGWQVG